MSVESVRPSNHLILFCSLLILLQSFPASGSFPEELALHIRWPKHWSFSFSTSPSNEYSGLTSFRIDWLDLAVQGSCKKSSPVPQFKSMNSWAFSLLYGPTLTSVHDYWKNHSFDVMDVCWQSDALFFNTLSRFVIVFLPRSKHLLISWLQLSSTVILEPKKIKCVTVCIFPPSICHEVVAMSLVFLNVEF